MCQNCKPKIEKNDVLLLEHKKTCLECEESILNDYIIDSEGNFICENCEDDYFLCCECDKNYHTDNENIFDNQLYCDDCFNEKTCVCESCDNRIDIDSGYYSDRDNCTYCESCWPGECGENEFESKKINLKENTFNLLKYKYNFGIELEIDNEDLPYYDIENNTCFGSKEDGSLNCGMEFYSPILQGDKGYNEIKKFCNNVNGYSVSTKAGYHLHIGAENFNYNDLKKIWLLYRIIEKYIYSILPASRQDNKYCIQSIIDIQHILNITSMDGFKILWNSHDNNNGTRYHGLNLTALESHNTIELRYHSGTINFDKIINWIKLNFELITFAKESSIEKILSLNKIVLPKDNLKNFEKLLNVLVDYNDVKEFYIERFKKLNGIKEEVLTV